MEINGTKIEARELTVGEMDEILGAFEASQQASLHICDILFPDRVPLDVARRSTGLETSFFEDLRPSEYETVLEAVEAANPTFMTALKRLAAIGRSLLPAAGSSPAKISPG